jgi:hypothetical protein
MPKKKLVDPATIRINHSTLKRLKAQGKYGEIIDDIINRVLDENEEVLRKHLKEEEQK